jgi:hypothetical protein
MTGELKMFPGPGKRDPRVVLELAKKGDLTEVLVIGINEAGELAVFGSMESARDIAWLIRQAEWWTQRNYAL